MEQQTVPIVEAVVDFSQAVVAEAMFGLGIQFDGEVIDLAGGNANTVDTRE